MTVFYPCALVRLVGDAPWAASLHYRDFRLLWASTLLYSLGTGMENVAVGWLIFDITGSPFMVGVAAAARMAPFFFLGLLSGAMSDRLDRRKFLIGINLTGAIVAGVIAVMPRTGSPPGWRVIGVVPAGGWAEAGPGRAEGRGQLDPDGPAAGLNGAPGRPRSSGAV